MVVDCFRAGKQNNDVTAKQLECEKETRLLGVDGERVHGIDGEQSRGGVRLDQVGGVSLTQSVKDARLVDETQRREIFGAAGWACHYTFLASRSALVAKTVAKLRGQVT